MPSATVSVSIPHSCVLQVWDRLSERDRRLEVIKFVQRQQGQAVTLNLSADIETALRSSKRPTRYISKRINHALNTVDLRGLPIMMVIEATRPEGRLHLHGVYIPGSYPKSSIHEALRRAAGYIEGRAGSRQVKSKTVHAAAGWHTYIHKDAAWTRRVLSTNEPLSWVAHPMTQLVRQEYEATRLGLIATANSNSDLKLAL